MSAARLTAVVAVRLAMNVIGSEIRRRTPR